MSILNSFTINEQRVLQALCHPRWSERSISGLANATGLPEEVVDLTCQRLTSKRIVSSRNSTRGETERKLFAIKNNGANTPAFKVVLAMRTLRAIQHIDCEIPNLPEVEVSTPDIDEDGDDSIKEADGDEDEDLEIGPPVNE